MNRRPGTEQVDGLWAKHLVLAVLVGVIWAGDLSAQGLEFVKANYTKYEYRIPMRDGKKLFTAVYAPKDTSQKYPMLLTRIAGHSNVGSYGVD